MNNTTDTNQASEDKLDKILYIAKVNWKTSPDEMFDKGVEINAKTAVKDLIRTEKLKLLAEVRERVVGEDLPTYGPQNENGDISEQDYLTYGANDLRADQRMLLTKLEAEL